MKRVIGALWAMALIGAALCKGEAFSLVQNQLELVLHTGFNHVTQEVEVVTNSAPFKGALTVTSDSAWVKPSWDATKGKIVLVFATSNLLQTQTATITARSAETTHDLFVHGNVVQLNVLKIVDDLVRSRAYAVHAFGLQLGSVLIMEPVSGKLLSYITVGRRPTDLVVSKERDELLVLNSADKAITVIDLTTLTIKETIQLPIYENWGADSTVGHLGLGPNNIIYYTDGAWAPVLHVYDRVSKQVLQDVGIDSNGFGNFALTSDKKTLIGWAQYGWTAGWAGSYLARFDVSTAGLLTIKEATDSQYPTVLGRDPLDTPVLIASDDVSAFVKQAQVNTGKLRPWIQAFPSPVYAISPGGEVAATSQGIYDTKSGRKLYSLNGNPTVQAVTSDYSRLIYFDPGTRTFQFVDLIKAVGSQQLNRDLFPADGSVVLPPVKLLWSPAAGVDRYRVYLGETHSSLEPTTPGTNEFLGETSAPEIVLSRTFLSGATYFWRVDTIATQGVTTGDIRSFTVSPISLGSREINISTLQGYKSVAATLDVSSAQPGAQWTAKSDFTWLSFVTNTGTTPAKIEIVVDASKLDVGVTNTSIHVGPSGGQLVSLPVQIRVEALSMTIIKADPASDFVYAISEDGQNPTPRAYLLEIDAKNEWITRLVEVGSSATDLAIHNPDGRIYVPNWRTGSLLAINKATFQIERSYAFNPFQGIGYGDGDVYRVSAGKKGQLIVEEYDQWIDISLFDTVSGTYGGKASVREGGGAFDPTGRYYYHGENNSSGATIQKYDVSSGSFVLLAAVRVETFSYYGSRVVTVSADGSRVFWNGSVFNADLVEEWAIHDQIYSTTRDGQYGFGADNVYDINRRKTAFGMPVSTLVSSFSDTTKKLVLQKEGRIAFFPLLIDSPLPKPVLFAGTITSTSVGLSWDDRSLETGFTLQSRIGPTAEWVDLPPQGQNQHQITLNNLSPGTIYQFRLRATSPVASSEWSDPLEVSTPGNAPVAPSGLFATTTPKSVQLSWGSSQYGTGFSVERRSDGETIWNRLAAVPSDTLSYLDLAVASGQTKVYRITATNAWGNSSSEELLVNVPLPQPPATPLLGELRLVQGLGIEINWNEVSQVDGYDLERRTENPESWTKILTVATGDKTSFVDTGIERNREYTYRVTAFGENGRSFPSQERTIVARRIECLISDDFVGTTGVGPWQVVSGGENLKGDKGFLDGKALWFGGTSARSATTIPVEVKAASQIVFSFRAGNRADGTNYWDVSELGEGVVIEYSVDGLRWVTLNSLQTSSPSFSSWVRVSLSLPVEAVSSTTQIRWRQLKHSGAGSDTWALDNFCLLGLVPEPPNQPPFIMVSAASSTSVSAFWVSVPGATRYVLERSNGMSVWTAVSTVGSQTWFMDTNCLPSTSYAYRVKAVNSGGSSIYSATAVAFTLSQLQDWQAQNLIAEGSSMSTPGADGIAPVARFAFNLPSGGQLSPYIPGISQGGIPSGAVRASGKLGITFLRRKSSTHPGIAYAVQFSSDCLHWEAGGSLVSQRDLDPVWELVEFEDASGASGIRFARIVTWELK